MSRMVYPRVFIPIVIVIGALCAVYVIANPVFASAPAAGLMSPPEVARLQATETTTQTTTGTLTATATTATETSITDTSATETTTTEATTATATLSPTSAVTDPAATPASTATPASDGASTGAGTQEPVQASATPTGTQEADGPLVGTIIANRATDDARFFVEGQTYVLAPGRSEGLALPRDTAVLSLYNCSAATPETETGCFWDPYLLRRDGFFEIYERPTSSAQPTLLLREAGAPPTDQVWVQNRTGMVESLVFRNEVIEIPPSSVKEFPVATGIPSILYVRSCITANEQTVCEWSPKTLDAGMYYAMIDVEIPGSLPESLISTVDLRPVLGDGSTEEAPAPTGMECVLLVPALNVRSGPGLQYEIIAKVRGTETEPGSVVVIGRSPDAQWLAVDGRVAPGGWIAGSGDYIRCSGDVMTLALQEVPQAAPQPQVAQAQTSPAPVAIATGPTEAVVVGTEPAPAQAADATEDPAPTATATSEPQGIPPGQALLVVNNGFPFEMRFTLDQIYRPIEGPSEYDLQPGDSVSVVVFPGVVAFTASTPWNSLANNAELTIGEDQSLTMWLRFEEDPQGSGQWVLRWN